MKPPTLVRCAWQANKGLKIKEKNIPRLSRMHRNPVRISDIIMSGCRDWPHMAIFQRLTQVKRHDSWRPAYQRPLNFVNASKASSRLLSTDTAQVPFTHDVPSTIQSTNNWLNVSKVSPWLLYNAIEKNLQKKVKVINLYSASSQTHL